VTPRPTTPLRHSLRHSLRPLALAVLVVAAAAAPRAAAQPLDAFLALASESVGVVTAMLERDDARRSLALVDGDPLALRLELVQARQRAELAEAEAEEALLEAYRDVAAAWARVREAELQVALAAASRDLAARSLEVARLRHERGSATVLDVQTASTDLLDAERTLQSASDGAALARADLEGVTGLSVEATEPLDRTRLSGLDVPRGDELVEAVLQVPAALRLQHAVELAGVAASLLDPSFASRRQIEEAALQQDQAAAAEREARRGLTLRARSLSNALASAVEGDRIAQDALRHAREREDVERRRLDAGLIAEIAFDAVRLQTARAELRAIEAEHAVVEAVLALQAGALWPVAGWHGF
jgi:outer membrane protein, heavy metal efflux system